MQIGQFTDVKAKNYRLFKKMDFNFEEKAGSAKKIVLMYGENGSGKTSIASLFSFLHQSVLSMELRDYDIGAILKKEKRISSAREPMELAYSFAIDGRSGVYKLIYDDSRLIEESLEFQLNKRMVSLFSLSNGEAGLSYSLSPRAFKEGKAKESLVESIKRFFGLHSFLSIIRSFMHSSNDGYIKQNIDQGVASVVSFFSSLVTGEEPSSYLETLNLASIDKDGYVHNKDLSYLDRSQKALSLFLSSLYPRLASVKFVKAVSINGEELFRMEFIEKQADGSLIEVPFDYESTGTRLTTSLFNKLFAASSGYTVIIDEIDKGIHDVLVFDILESVLPMVSGQLIITTHNTLLMKHLSAKNIFLLNFEPNGEETFYSLDEVDQGRITSKTDVVGRYLKGLYGGIPYAPGLSMQTIQYALNEDEKKK